MTDPKTYGQIAYEAMLKRIRENPDIPGHDPNPQPTGSAYLDGVWEAQPQQLRDDWEAVASEVTKEHAYRNGR